MNRREAIATAIGAVAGACVPVVSKPAYFVKCVPLKWAYASVDHTPQLVGKVNVFVDGKQVTAKEANAREGWAVVIEKDESGGYAVDWERKELAWKKVFGKVEIVSKEL